MNPLRRAAIWTVAIELPLALLALLSTVPVLYRTVPLVLTTHIPGIFLLDTLHMCCGIRRPSFEPPVPVSIAILALANAGYLPRRLAPSQNPCNCPPEREGLSSRLKCAAFL